MKVKIIKLLMFLTVIGLSYNCYSKTAVSLEIGNVVATVKSDGEPGSVFSSVSHNSAQVNTYEKYELSVVLSKSYTNPYEPDEVDLYCEFVSPSGMIYIQNGFYYTNYTQLLSSDPEFTLQVEHLVEGSSLWRIRFAPNQSGTWSYRVILKDITGTYAYPSSGYNNFTCINDAENKGFVRTQDSRYLKFDNGDFFFPVSMNYDWYQSYGSGSLYLKDLPGTVEIDHYYSEISVAGINTIRIYLSLENSWNIWNYDTYSGENFYKYFNQADSWRIDKALEYAKRDDIYVTLSLVDAGYFGNGSFWEQNPYNKNVVKVPSSPDTKGDCNEASDFYTSTDAKKTYKNYARYVQARWGYSTNVMSFETVNEGDYIIKNSATNNTDFSKIIDWQSEIYNYIKSEDPYKHLISYSMGEPGLHWEQYQQLSEFVDYQQAHSYTKYRILPDGTGGDDNYNLIFKGAIQNLRNHSNYVKPVLISEYDYVAYVPDHMTDDPLFYDFHNNNWGTIFGGGMSIASFMYWPVFMYDDNLRPIALERYKGAAKYINTIPYLDDSYTPEYAESNGFRAFYLKGNNGKTLYGWMQDDNFSFYNIYNTPSYKPYLTDLSSNRPPYSSQSYNYTFSLPVGVNNTKYEVKIYDTETGNLEEKRIVTSLNNYLSLNTLKGNGEPGEKYIDNIFADMAFTASCKPTVGWVEKQSCPKQYNNVRNDSELESDANGSHIFYIRTDGQVCNLYKNGNAWGDGPLNTNARPAISGRGLVYNSSDGAVYYIGNDSYIYKFYYSSTLGWQSQKICSGQWNYVRSDSELETDVNGSHIFYINGNRQICNLYKSGSSWGDGPLNTSARKAISGRGLIYNPLDGGVYYVGDDSYIYRFIYLSGSGWQSQKICPGQWNYVSSGSELKRSNSGGNIFYVNTYRQICNLYSSGGSWGDGPLNTSAPLIKANTNFTFDKNSSTLYYMGDDNNIYRIYYNNGWQYGKIHQTGFCQELALDGMEFKGSTLYYTGIDNRIHEFYYTTVLKNATISNDNDVNKNIIKIKNEPQKTIDEVLLYPNPLPVGSELNVVIPEGSNNTEISVINSSGMVVKRFVDVQNNSPLDVNDLSKGLYIVNIKTDYKMTNKKLIIK